MCACMHNYVHVFACNCNIMCSAGPEVYIAVLDLSALKQIQYIGKGGGGVVVAGLQVACEAHIQGGKYWGISPQKKRGI